MQFRSTGNPSPALSVTHNLEFTPPSRTAHRTWYGAQLLLVLVHVHVHIVALVRLALPRVCRRSSHHCLPLFLRASSTDPGTLISKSKPTPSSLGHCCSVAPASPTSPSMFLGSAHRLSIQTDRGSVRSPPPLRFRLSLFNRELPHLLTCLEKLSFHR